MMAGTGASCLAGLFRQAGLLVMTLLVLLFIVSPMATAAEDDTAAAASSFSSASPSRHLNLFPGQSIASEVTKDATSNFNSTSANKKYTLHAKYTSSSSSSASANDSSTATSNDFMINVRVATPAVTSMTTTSVHGGANRFVNITDLAFILVSDEEQEDGIFALIAVEKVENGRVKGIIQKGGGESDIEFLQENGQGQQVRRP